MKYRSYKDFLEYVERRNPGQPEYLQAVTEVIETLWGHIERNPKYAEQGLLERLVEPERVVLISPDSTALQHAASQGYQVLPARITRHIRSK